MAIEDLSNFDVRSSIRAKLNEVIAWVNGLIIRHPDTTSYLKSNLFWGYLSGNDDSLADETENLNNTYLGVQSGQLSRTGNDNTGVGRFNLFKNLYSSRNTSSGYASMFEHNVGDYNCAYGYQSQQDGLYQYRNASFGYKTLESLYIGKDNAAFGYKALQIVNPTSAVITGYTDIGGGQTRVITANSLSNGNTIYISGTAIPRDHIYQDNYDGSYVVESVSGTDFVINIAYIDVGTLITLGGWAIPTEGITNTGLGSFAGGEIEKGSYNICIGNDAQVDDKDADYQLSIGNVLKGDLQTGKLFVTGDTFGISTTKTPSSSSDTGKTGQIAWDATYIYICIATNIWKRSLIETW